MNKSKGMRRFRDLAMGTVIGFLLGIAVSASAQRIVGNDGYLMGWDITYRGEVICSDPFIWRSIMEIECE